MGAPSVINVYGVSILPPCLGYCICKYMVTLVFSKLSIILHCNFPMMPLALKVPKRKQHCRDSRLAWRAMYDKWVDSRVNKINTKKVASWSEYNGRYQCRTKTGESSRHAPTRELF